jgi:hypothetical protein
MHTHSSFFFSSSTYPNNILLSSMSMKGRLSIELCLTQNKDIVEKVGMMSGTSFSNTSYAKPGLRPNGHQVNTKSNNCVQFQMPLHYPRYKKSDYETMPEWKLDSLLNEYGLPVTGDVTQKRKFAMGAFLWPSQQ